MIQFKDGKPLIVSGMLAMDPACCCGGTCAYSVHAQLDWGNNADLDLYASVDGGAATYYANRSQDGLMLDTDAHPACDPAEMTPENTTGNFTTGHLFRFWYNQWSFCATETPPTVHHVEITNTGTGNICVNGATVAPGETWQGDVLAYAGYATFDQSAFAGGTEVQVTCGSCP